jgi:uncharacterized protein YjiK
MHHKKERTRLPIFIKLHKNYNSGFPFGYRILALLISVVFLAFCKPRTADMNVPDEDPFAYDLETPDARYKLPAYLEEISGLSFLDNGKIACVQDEKAFIYVLNLEKEKIVNEYDFGKDADYEDIAVVDKTAYVLRSDGDIYRIKNFRKKDRKVKKIETALKEKNDTEGLAYDPLSSSLLIACKGSPSIDKDNRYKGYKAIYQFDLKEEELIKEPHFLIDLERLDSYIDQNVFSKLSVRVAKRLHLIESETSFQPSGLAIHPLYGEIYIISSVGKLLIILDRRGKVLNVKELDPIKFRQPEGICFAPNGDMYISNEGQGGKGYILKFEFHDTQE